jgi:hypothetical protein
MSDLANWLRVIAEEMAAHDEPPSWHQPIVEAADEIEKLQATLIEINELNAKRIGYSKKIERVIWKALGEKE